MFELFALTSPWPDASDWRSVMQHKTKLMSAARFLEHADPRLSKIAASGAAQWELKLVEMVDEDNDDKERRLQSAFELASDAGDASAMTKALAEWDRRGLPSHRRFRREAEKRRADAVRALAPHYDALNEATGRMLRTQAREHALALYELSRTVSDGVGIARVSLPALLHAALALPEHHGEANLVAHEVLYAAPLDGTVVPALRLLGNDPALAQTMFDRVRPWIAPNELAILTFGAEVEHWRLGRGPVPSRDMVTKALAAVRNLSDLPEGLRALAFMNVVGVLLVQEPREALAVIDEALVLFPTNENLYAWRARTLAATGELDAALAQLRRCPASPFTLIAAGEIGAALVSAQRWKDAVAPLERVLSDTRIPDDVRGAFLNDLGIALAQLGRVDDARTSLRQARVLLPNDPRPAENLARLDAADTPHLATITDLAQLRAALVPPAFPLAA